eukprot:CAMPEP_0194373266 /NCGR_PEP_ID=MMETSP0174-20130528/21690_1 /TAXON_ID=216777 /ORGANISM="Proboscia alata, Strain PI-D3" /LENGTH=77 /DNA_ID=CAMNT_0039152235 /DNA_START=305 /DNA_END=538 /DNA_ORIENTATION=-
MPRFGIGEHGIHVGYGRGLNMAWGLGIGGSRRGMQAFPFIFVEVEDTFGVLGGFDAFHSSVGMNNYPVRMRGWGRGI